MKDLYFRHRWESDQYESGMKHLREVVRFQFCMPPIHLKIILKFDEYYIPVTAGVTPTDSTVNGES